MIVSHKHRFVFIKTHKTASSSIEVALSKVCGPDDIITEVPPEAHRDLVENYLNGKHLDKWIAQNQRHKGLDIDPHCSGKWILENIPDVQDYLWFTVERHPHTKCLSNYHYQLGRLEPEHAKKYNFNQFLDSEEVPLDIDLWCNDGVPIVEGIMRFEHIEADFKQLCGFLNIETELPHINKNHSTEFLELDPLQKQKIMKLFSNSNKFTGYGQ